MLLIWSLTLQQQSRNQHLNWNYLWLTSFFLLLCFQDNHSKVLASRSFSRFASSSTVRSRQRSLLTTAAFVRGPSSNNNSSSSSKATSSTTTTTNSKRTIMSSSFDKEALIKCPTIKLRNGMEHPAIGFGTYKVGFIPASASSATSGANNKPQGEEERTAEECVLDALTLGYRFLECAEFYGNEAQVGSAIQKSGIPRDQLFLCSKVWTTTIEQGPDAIRKQLDQTLKDLQTDYLDLYLIHWPVPGHHVEAYKTLEAIMNETPSKLKGIGVSNYAVEDIQELINEPSVKTVPLVNQIEINPFLYRKNTIAFCQQEGVVLQSYRSLRDGKAMNHPTLMELAQKYKTTVAQILGRWCVQKGFVYMPKSVQPHRMQENAQVFDQDFTIETADMTLLDGLTTPENLQTFVELYRKCVNRDTTKDGTLDGVKMDITID